MARTTKNGEATSLMSKILQVIEAVSYVQKDAENQHDRYTYVSEAAVMAALRGAIAQAGLVVYPPSVDTVEILGVEKNGGKSPIMLIRYTVTIGHTDGPEEKTFSILGGANLAAARDKSPYVAQTGAMKYCLCKLFLLPTGDAEPEDDSHNDKPLHEELARKVFKYLKEQPDLNKFEEALRKAGTALNQLEAERPDLHNVLLLEIEKLRLMHKQARTAGIVKKVAPQAEEAPEMEEFPHGE